MEKHIMSESKLYERMKARGIDMSWYERSKARLGDSTAIPLETEVCNSTSVYLLKQDGSLWTINAGDPYHQVREGQKPVIRSTYVCLCCKAQYVDYSAFKHEEK